MARLNEKGCQALNLFTIHGSSPANEGVTPPPSRLCLIVPDFGAPIPRLDLVYIVNESACMATVVQSCRIEEDHAALLSKQAKRRHMQVSSLSSLYLQEKSIEEEYPGIGFRDGAGGREAYVLGHRVAIWEVKDVYSEAKSITRTADHFGWPDYLVKCALAYAKAFPDQIAVDRKGEVGE